MIVLTWHQTSGESGVIEPKDLKIRRRYEEKEFSFVAQNLSFSCQEMPELYEKVVSNEDVYVAVNKDGETIFWGILQSEGSTYDPENDEYNFSVAHIIKKIFSDAETYTEFSNWLRFDWDKVGGFDVIQNARNNLHTTNWLPPVKLNKSDFEFSSIADLEYRQRYVDFVNNNPDYTEAQYWKDFAQHYKAILFCDDVIDPVEKQNVLHIVPRKILENKTPIIGLDSLICEYKEEQKNPNYDAVIFPLKLNWYTAINITSEPDRVRGFMGIATYTLSGIKLEFGCADAWLPVVREYTDVMHRYKITRDRYENQNIFFRDVNTKIEPSGEILNQCVPVGLYNNTLIDFQPFKSIPNFELIDDNGITFGAALLKKYVEDNFKSSIFPYKEITVKYSELRFDILLYGKVYVDVRQKNLPVYEIEYDLLNETTECVLREYAE